MCSPALPARPSPNLRLAASNDLETTSYERADLHGLGALRPRGGPISIITRPFRDLPSPTTRLAAFGHLRSRAGNPSPSSAFFTSLSTTLRFFIFVHLR